MTTLLRENDERKILYLTSIKLGVSRVVDYLVDVVANSVRLVENLNIDIYI